MAGPDLLTAVLDSVPFPITSVAPDGTILFVNRMAAGNLSGSREDVVGTSVYDYFPDRAAATRERIRQTVNRRTVQHFVSEVILPDGRQKYFDSAYCPAFDADGEVIAVQIVARDVTEQMAAERERSDAASVWGVVSDDLSMTAGRVKAILETAPLVVAVCDPDLTVRYINHVIEGTSIDQVVGHSALKHLSEDSRPVVERAFARAIEYRETAVCEIEGASGRSWFVRVAPLIDRGEVTQVLACTVEITEQKRLQAQLAQRNKIESLGTMARGIAHDFNNLLTTVMGNTGLARRRLATGRDAMPLLDEIDLASRRAADLCEQMLVYAGRDRTDDDPADLNRVIEDMAPLTRAAINATIRIAYDLDRELPLALCNRAQLGQVVLNLVNNAADAIGDGGGNIRVATRVVDIRGELTGYLPDTPAPGRYVRLDVSDDGHGVDPGILRHIFDPFYSTRVGGHGLGLSVVLGIIAAHNAAIGVESGPGGTTMTALFPALDAAADPADATPTEPSWTGGEGTVLVVDDEASVRRMAALLLGEAGYQVIEAADGDEALEVLASRGAEICAVLLDVTMPGRDGHSTLNELRKDFPGLPVLLSSGKPIELAKPDPNVRVLLKPYPAVLLARVIGEAVRVR